MEEQLRKIRECIATMMDVLPNPAIAVVTVKDEKKSKNKTAEVNKEHEVQQKQ